MIFILNVSDIFVVELGMGGRRFVSMVSEGFGMRFYSEEVVT